MRTGQSSDVGIEISRGFNGDLFHRDPVAPSSPRQRDSRAGEERDPCPQREDRRASSRRGLVSEELDGDTPDRHVLVSDDPGDPSGPQTPEQPLRRVVTDDQVHPEARPGLNEITIEERIPLTGRDRIHRVPSRRHGRARDLPVAEVTREQDRTQPTGGQSLEGLPPLDELRTLENRVAGLGGESERRHRLATEVPPGGSGDSTALGVREVGEGAFEILAHDPSANADHTTRKPTEDGSEGSGRCLGEARQSGTQHPKPEVLGPVTERDHLRAGGRLRSARVRHSGEVMDSLN